MSPPTLTRDVLQHLWGAGIGASVIRGARLYEAAVFHVEVREQTAFEFSLDPGGLYLRLEPALSIGLRGPLPGFEVGAIRYKLDQAKFHVDMRAARVDPLRLGGAILGRVIEEFLNGVIRPRLPAQLLVPGYSMQDDADLPGTMRALQRAFPTSSSNASAVTAGDALAGLADPNGYLQVSIPSDVHIPLEDSGGLEAFLQGGAQLFVSVRASGSLLQPRVDYLQIDTQQNALTLRSTAVSFVGALSSLTIRRVTITSGGHFTFDYDLLVEDILRGEMALLQLLGLAQDGTVTSAAPDVKLQVIRDRIDAMLALQVPPRLRALLAEYDTLLPAMSLLEVFGMGR